MFYTSMQHDMAEGIREHDWLWKPIVVSVISLGVGGLFGSTFFSGPVSKQAAKDMIRAEITNSPSIKALWSKVHGVSSAVGKIGKKQIQLELSQTRIEAKLDAASTTVADIREETRLIRDILINRMRKP